MKSISTTQAVVLLSMAMLSTKIQRMPAIVSQMFGRNGWLFLLISIIPDLIMLLVVLRISTLTRGKTVYQALSERVGRPVAIIYSLFIGLFFFAKILTPFKGTHEFFVSAIFDDLDWQWFSILFILLLMFMASAGLNRIGRTAEILWFFVAIGMVGAFLLAIPTARFHRILPVEIFDFKTYSMGSKNLTAWIADFVILLFFVGRVKERHYKTAMVVTFIVTALFVSFFCMTFYAIYDNQAIFPNVGISAITEFSLLSFSLGRVDWVLTLFVMTASVISTGLFALVACESFYEVTTLPKKWIAPVIAIIIYVLDIYIFSNYQVFTDFSFKIESWFILFVNYVLPFVVWLLLGITKNKKPKYDYYPYKVRPKSMQELHLKKWNSLSAKTKPAYPLQTKEEQR